MKKCNAKKGFCVVAEEMVPDGTGERRQGLFQNQTINMNTNKLYRRLIFRGPGGTFALKFCPFCGVEIKNGVARL